MEGKPSQAECPEKAEPDSFICRKGWTALNIQVIGDSHPCIRDCDVKWMGSTHDGRVYRRSRGKRLIEQQAVYALAADSAYLMSRTVVKPYPLAKRPTESHKMFNYAQARLRNDCTEKIFGQVCDLSQIEMRHKGPSHSIIAAVPPWRRYPRLAGGVAGVGQPGRELPGRSN